MSLERKNTEVADTKPGSQVRLGDGKLMSQKDAPLGGQAVIEGVMMRGVATWAVAVRLPVERSATQAPSPNGAEPNANGLGPIEIHSEPFVSSLKRRRLFRLPIIRGVVALVESMKIGLGALGFSANAQLEEPDEKISGGAWGITVAIALIGGIGLFFVLPVTIANFWKDQVGSSLAFVMLEKLIRVSILVLYIWAISRIRDLRRVFEYHGAEHKTIACYEADDELTPTRAKLYSRFHIRCGTSFLLLVVIVSLFVFAPIGRPALGWLIASRVLGFPIVTGLAYELIRWAGRNRRKRWVRALMWPGLQLQRLTTREPSLDQLAVAIAALEAVLAVEDPRVARQDLMGLEVGA